MIFFQLDDVADVEFQWHDPFPFTANYRGMYCLEFCVFLRLLAVSGRFYSFGGDQHLIAILFRNLVRAWQGVSLNYGFIL